MTATAAPPAAVLSHEEVCRFYRDGYLVVPHLLGTEDLDQVRTLLDGLFDRWKELPANLAFDLGDVKNHDGAQRMPQINTAVQFEPRLKDTRVYHRCHEAARQLLGADAGLSFDHAIYKPARNHKETPWHQDLAYGRRPHAICANANFWIPLQDATVDNGCMWFIPHSHLGNLLPHRPVGGDPRVHTLEVLPDSIDTRAAVACPIAAGGVTIQHGKTLHYTGPNITDQPRRAWILNFGVPVENTWQKA